MSTSLRFPIVFRCLPLLALFCARLAARCYAAAASQPQSHTEAFNPVVIVFGFNRAAHLRQAIRSLGAAAVNVSRPLRIIVSIDDSPRFARVEQAAQRDNIVDEVWRHKVAGMDERDAQRLDVRTRISLHYRDSFTKLFSNGSVTHALIFEDDLRVSRDGLEFLLCALPHLWPTVPDSRIVTASVWNDNARAAQPGLWTLTTFFPGLGWVLSRRLWEELGSQWPPILRTLASPANSSIVGTGWDYWLRVRFFRHRWLAITPAVARVRHVSTFGGGLGVGVSRDGTAGNVRASQQRAHFDPARTASTGEDWCAEFRRTGISEQTHIQRVRAIDRVVPFDRVLFDRVAKHYRLWPNPRGFYFHVLPLIDEDDTANHTILLYDRLRAPETFPHLSQQVKIDRFGKQRPHNNNDDNHRFSFTLDDSPKTSTRMIVARLNQSCEQACAALRATDGKQWRCTRHALDLLNDCDQLDKLFGAGSGGSGNADDECKRGTVDVDGNPVSPCLHCGFETGPDLPARVVKTAPLKTASYCLITEEVTRYDCAGRFTWTQRACGCESSQEDDVQKTDGGHTVSEWEVHDEL